ncbi:hypothetical protein V8G54_019161 [Vigna mungo]|uniref:Pentatricopeptide repeat-containing protein n=1 Tax=Vigna mungo TaxID=3915 RepID=A0AAQ3NB66_VIGMU
MRRNGVLPGKHTFPFLLKACSQLCNLSACKQLHVHVMKFGLASDLHVANALVRCYLVSGNWIDACFLFDEMTKRSSSLWTTMICGYTQNFRSKEALQLFSEMVGAGFEPGGATLASVLSACARSGYLKFGERIHGFVKVKGVGLGDGVILGTALVYMYAKNGEISKPGRLFDEMPERNVVTWNVMMCGLGAHGYVEDDLDLFEKMKREHVICPNGVTFVGVLSACCHAGLIDVGR